MATSMVPSGSCAAVTTSDATSFARGECRGLSVTTSGSYTILLSKDSTAVAMYLAAGIIHPLRAVRVNTTGAASTSGIVAFY